MNKDVRRLMAAARKAGWRVEVKRHVRLYPTDKRHSPITVSLSPSDQHATTNARADCRRAGLNI